MTHPHFQAYLLARERGMKAAAKAALAYFVKEMQADPEHLVEWIHQMIDTLPEGQPHPNQVGFLRMRHEIWRDLICPYLLDGRQEGAVWQICQLARFSQNWIGAPGGPLKYNIPQDLWREALAIDPSNTLARQGLAEDLARGLAYAFHEWPAGLLGRPEELAAEIAEVVQLDHEGRFEKDLREYEAILRGGENP